MNANELADTLDDVITEPWQAEGWLKTLIQQTATMLRQLQTENEALKAENAKMKTKLIGYGLLKALDNFGKVQEK